MIKFTYHQQYNKSEYNELKRKAEGSIKKYMIDSFKAYADLDIEIQLLPTKLFIGRGLAVVNISESSIQFNFDNYCGYLRRLKKHNGKLLVPSIRDEHNFIYNSLYHEMQHIINRIEHEDTFKYIDSIDSCGYIKVAISIFLDEYLASYYAQKQHFYKLIDDGGLAYICKKKDVIIATKSESDKIAYYIELCKLLAYSIAQCKAIGEKKNIEAFDTILNDESVIEFRDIFKNIQALIEGYDTENVKEYTEGCESQIMKLLSILEIDLDYLKEIDSVTV